MDRYTVEIRVPEACAVEQAGEKVEIDVLEDEHVLAARSEGLWLPADCKQGWCTTCAAELLSGEVDQSDAKRYYEEDSEEGMILTCTAEPRSDLSIRACQYDEMLEQRAEPTNRQDGRSDESGDCFTFSNAIGFFRFHLIGTATATAGRQSAESTHLSFAEIALIRPCVPLVD